MSKKEVLDSYETISSVYNRLKRTPWRDLIKFLESHEWIKQQMNGKICFDVGCGNGRNFSIMDNFDEIVGFDISRSLLLNAPRTPRTHRVVADMANLPVRDGIADWAYMIASLQHLPTKNDRINAIRNVNRALKKDGCLFLTTWRRWQKSLWRKFVLQYLKKIIYPKTNLGDLYMPWKMPDGKIVYRYYHFFTNRELKKLIEASDFKINIVEKYGGKGQKDNIFLIACKNKKNNNRP